MTKTLNYIGMAKKAGAVAIGETNTGAAIRAGKGKVLILAADASDNARRRAEGFLYGTKLPMAVLPYTKAELSQITGMGGCSMAAFTEIGFAAVFMAALAEEEPSFRDLAAFLEEKNQKAWQRKKEALAHEKNMKKGGARFPTATGKRRKST